MNFSFLLSTIWEIIFHSHSQPPPTRSLELSRPLSSITCLGDRDRDKNHCRPLTAAAIALFAVCIRCGGCSLAMWTGHPSHWLVIHRLASFSRTLESRSQSSASRGQGGPRVGCYPATDRGKRR